MPDALTAIITYPIKVKYEILRGDPTDDQLKEILSHIPPNYSVTNYIACTENLDRWTHSPDQITPVDEYHESWKFILRVYIMSWHATTEFGWE